MILKVIFVTLLLSGNSCKSKKLNQIYKLFLLHKAGSMPADQWEIAATEADQILNLTEFGRTFRKENVAYWQMWEEMEQLESKDLSKF